MIVLNICKEDINWKEAKNGKSYANIATDYLKEVDENSNTHTVWNNQSKEERAEKAKKNYCGRGKEVAFNGVNATGKKEFAVNQQEFEAHSEDDIPY
jgi:hypothetical protein